MVCLHNVRLKSKLAFKEVAEANFLVKLKPHEGFFFERKLNHGTKIYQKNTSGAEFA